MAEFKIDISQDYTQVFADMARVASNMLIDSLKRWEIVNIITIYGFLLLKKQYLADNNNNLYNIPVGQKDFFNKLFLIEHLSWTLFLLNVIRVLLL